MNADEEFMDDLIALWRRIGSPPVEALALRLKQPLARFQFLAGPRTSVLPDWMDVLALLRAAGENQGDVVLHWRRRWEGLLQSPVERVRTTKPVAPENNAAGILRNAMVVKSREEFVMRLEDLRTTLNVSFGQIAKHTLGRLPKSTANWMVQRDNFPAHADQIRLFVGACGVSAEETDLWVRAWERARHMHSLTPLENDHQVYFHQRTAESLAAQGKHRDAYDHFRSALALAMQGRPQPDHLQLVGNGRPQGRTRSVVPPIRERQSFF